QIEAALKGVDTVARQLRRQTQRSDGIVLPGIGVQEVPAAAALQSDPAPIQDHAATIMALQLQPQVAQGEISDPGDQCQHLIRINTCAAAFETKQLPGAVCLLSQRKRRALDAHIGQRPLPPAQAGPDIQLQRKIVELQRLLRDLSGLGEYQYLPESEHGVEPSPVALHAANLNLLAKRRGQALFDVVTIVRSEGHELATDTDVNRQQQQQRQAQGQQ